MKLIELKTMCDNLGIEATPTRKSKNSSGFFLK